jgi:hypothetical protein
VSSDNGYAAVTPNVAVRGLSLLLRILEVRSSIFGPHCGRPDRGFGYFSEVLATRCRHKVQVNVLPVHTTVAWWRGGGRGIAPFIRNLGASDVVPLGKAVQMLLDGRLGGRPGVIFFLLALHNP